MSCVGGIPPSLRSLLTLIERPRGNAGRARWQAAADGDHYPVLLSGCAEIGLAARQGPQLSSHSIATQKSKNLSSKMNLLQEKVYLIQKFCSKLPEPLIVFLVVLLYPPKQEFGGHSIFVGKPVFDRAF
jgi:hypothetical protein